MGLQPGDVLTLAGLQNEAREQAQKVVAAAGKALLGVPSPTGKVLGIFEYAAMPGQLASIRLGDTLVSPTGPPFGIASQAANGEPACWQCCADLSKAAGREVDLWPGTFVRTGQVLRCVSCGCVTREPIAWTLQRHEEELQRLRMPRRSRLQRRWK